MEHETKKLISGLPVGYILNFYYSTLHNHEYYEFFCISKGKGLNVINNVTQLLEPKCLMLIRPNDMHYIRKIDEFDGTFEAYNIPIPKEFIEKEFDSCKELKDFVLTPAVPHRVSITASQLASLSEKAQTLIKLPVSETRSYLYFKLIQEICACLLSNPIITEKNDEIRFSKLLSEFESLEIEDLSYDKMLKISNVSGTALWKIFKKQLNISPSDYIKARRADKAYELLLNTDKSLLDIAMQLGYGSYVQFYRDIKNRFNMTPKEMRKQ